jgi:hypothetical protein
MEVKVMDFAQYTYPPITLGEACCVVHCSCTKIALLVQKSMTVACGCSVGVKDNLQLINSSDFIKT